MLLFLALSASASEESLENICKRGPRTGDDVLFARILEKDDRYFSTELRTLLKNERFFRQTGIDPNASEWSGEICSFANAYLLQTEIGMIAESNFGGMPYMSAILGTVFDNFWRKCPPNLPEYRLADKIQLLFENKSIPLVLEEYLAAIKGLDHPTFNIIKDWPFENICQLVAPNYKVDARRDTAVFLLTALLAFSGKDPYPATTEVKELFKIALAHPSPKKLEIKLLEWAIAQDSAFAFRVAFNNSNQKIVSNYSDIHNSSSRLWEWIGASKLSEFLPKLNLSFDFEALRGIHPVLINTQMDSNQAYRLFLAGQCESGDNGSQLPIYGQMKEGQLIPYQSADPEWYYEIKDHSGGVLRRQNGLYMRESFGFDPNTHFTSITLRAMQPGEYFLKVRCSGKEEVVQIQVAPMAKQVTVARAESAPQYDEMDQDGVRRGLFVAGSHTRPASVIVNFLLSPVYGRFQSCEKTEIIPDKGKEALLNDLGIRGPGQIDYLIRNVHANGAVHDAGAFTIPAVLNRYVCRKQVGDLKHEVIVYGDENDAKNPSPPVTVGYFDFFEAIDNKDRGSNLLVGNFSCWSVAKSAFEMVNLKNLNRFSFLSTSTVAVSYPTGDRFYPLEEEAFALLSAMIAPNRMSYAQMRNKYIVFNQRKVLFPDQPEAIESHNEAAAMVQKEGGGKPSISFRLAPRQ